MASYKVILKPSVEKDLRFLPREAVKRVFRRIEMLKDDPLPRQSLKLSGAELISRTIKANILLLAVGSFSCHV
jgi:mRNA-degrading endonuclease RelE of RelBE toxin-antitoxin system